MRIKEHLEPDGIFIVNVFNPCGRLDEQWCNTEELVDFEVFYEENNIHVMRKTYRERIDVEKQVIYPYFVYEVSYPDGTIERIIEHLKMRYYYQEQIYNKIKNSGMQIVKEFS